MMADNTNSIDIAVTNAVDPEIAVRIITIADAADRAGRSVGSLKSQMASMSGSGLGGLSTLLQDVQSGSVAAATAQSNLASAVKDTTSGSMAANSALRVMTGSMFGATRAAGSFLSMVPGLGRALSVAFPVIGAIALVDILYQVGSSLYKTIEAAENAGRNIAKAFDEAIGTLRKSNDELSITNDKLDQTISKLQGRPTTNGVQLALDEARSSADKLDDSLERVQKDLDQTLNKYSISFIGSLFTGQSTTAGTADFIQKQFDKLNDVRQKATEAIDQATSLRDPKASLEALTRAYTRERTAIQGVVTALQSEYNAKKAIQDTPAIDVQTPYGPTQTFKEDQTANLAMLEKAAHLAQEEMRGLDLTMQNIGKNNVVDKLRDHTSALKEGAKEAAAQWKQLEAAFVSFQTQMDHSGHKATAQENLSELEKLGQGINPLNADRLTAKELPYRNQLASNQFKQDETAKLQDQINEIGLYSNALKEAADLNSILEAARRKNIDLSPQEIAGYKSQIAQIVESRQYTEELSSIYEQTTGAALKFSSTLEALSTLYGRDQISEQTYAQGITQTMKEYNEATSAVTKFTDALAIQQQEESNRLGTQRQISVKETLQGLDEKLREPGVDASHPFGYRADEITKVNAQLTPLITQLQNRNAVEQETNRILNQQANLEDQLATKAAARAEAVKQGAMSQQAANSAALKDKLSDNNQQLSNGIGGNPYFGSIAQYAQQFTTLAKGIEDAFTPVFKTLSDGFADSLGRAIAYGQNLGEALKNVAREGIAEIISGLVKLGIQEVINLTLGAAAGSAAAAAAAAQGAAVNAAWAPAAYSASVATFGAADAIGMTAYTSGMAVARVLALIPGFAVGTNYVPSDMVAQIHAGERIVPAADNAVLIDAMKTRNQSGSTRQPIEIHNYGPQRVQIQQTDDNRIRVIVRQETPSIIQQHAPGVIAKDIANPNSPTSKAIARNVTPTRNR